MQETCEKICGKEDYTVKDLNLQMERVRIERDRMREMHVELEGLLSQEKQLRYEESTRFEK